MRTVDDISPPDQSLSEQVHVFVNSCYSIDILENKQEILLLTDCEPKTSDSGRSF